MFNCTQLIYSAEWVPQFTTFSCIILHITGYFFTFTCFFIRYRQLLMYSFKWIHLSTGYFSVNYSLIHFLTYYRVLNHLFLDFITNPTWASIWLFILNFILIQTFSQLTTLSCSFLHFPGYLLVDYSQLQTEATPKIPEVIFNPVPY